jgi:hypothetical protein
VMEVSLRVSLRCSKRFADLDHLAVSGDTDRTPMDNMYRERADMKTARIKCVDFVWLVSLGAARVLVRTPAGLSWLSDVLVTFLRLSQKCAARRLRRTGSLSAPGAGKTTPLQGLVCVSGELQASRHLPQARNDGATTIA